MLPTKLLQRRARQIIVASADLDRLEVILLVAEGLPCTVIGVCLIHVDL